MTVLQLQMTEAQGGSSAIWTWQIHLYALTFHVNIHHGQLYNSLHVHSSFPGSAYQEAAVHYFLCHRHLFIPFGQLPGNFQLDQSKRGGFNTFLQITTISRQLYSPFMGGCFCSVRKERSWKCLERNDEWTMAVVLPSGRLMQRDVWLSGDSSLGYQPLPQTTGDSNFLWWSIDNIMGEIVVEVALLNFNRSFAM